MITKIGIVAGDIWSFLEKKGKVSLSELAGELEEPQELLLMSLGWLAREGHIILKKNKDYEISLRKNIKN